MLTALEQSRREKIAPLERLLRTDRPAVVVEHERQRPTGRRSNGGEVAVSPRRLLEASGAANRSIGAIMRFGPGAIAARGLVPSASVK
jgi:hypothetical protein